MNLEHALVRDPYFGLPLTPFEREVWLRILMPKKSWRERMHLLLKRATSPFGAGSGGAGGNLSTSELGTVPGGAASWPVWLYPTPDFQNFDKYGATALAAGPSTGTVGDGVYANGNSMPWQVPKGLNGFIKTMAIQDTAGLWTPGVATFQMSFTLLVNAVSPPDYGLIAYSPGLVVAPAPIAGVPIKSLNEVELTFDNASIDPGAGDSVYARLQGYYYGQQYEPKEMAF
jgi:hypothetical protein